MKFDLSSAVMVTPSSLRWQLLSDTRPIRPYFGYFYFYFTNFPGGIA
ncbi:MAG: hypothetical protein LBS44_01060 [Deltaproteobacteria bacterium]|jgi:hypothetical protein|nr:hypothetical protein [Deltaproteobacteria bacterium]